MLKVQIIGKPNCHYCIKAKKLLNEGRVDGVYIEATPDEQQRYKELGHTTMPIIYDLSDESLIGGYTELLRAVLKHESVSDF